MTILALSRPACALLQKLLRPRARIRPAANGSGLLRAGKYETPQAFSPWLTFLR
jgi:hypothetical protein